MRISTGQTLIQPRCGRGLPMPTNSPRHRLQSPSLSKSSPSLNNARPVFSCLPCLVPSNRTTFPSLGSGSLPGTRRRRRIQRSRRSPPPKICRCRTKRGLQSSDTEVPRHNVRYNFTVPSGTRVIGVQLERRGGNSCSTTQSMVNSPYTKLLSFDGGSSLSG